MAARIPSTICSAVNRRLALLAAVALLSAAQALGGSAAPPAGIGLVTLRLVDTSRTIQLPGSAVKPRTLLTSVRYPLGLPGAHPLVVFGHGFASTPALYRSLLEAWTRAGYVVAAPLFPLENALAPGGPNERDLINQPADMRFVVSRLLELNAAAGNRLSGRIDPAEIAVAGHSDGGETALAVAFGGSRFRDRRVRAAVILSGAELSGRGVMDLRAPGPALLAVQGTRDAINPPKYTNVFYAAAPRPKFLLRLLGVGHLPPYTSQQPQLDVVERVTIAFLDRYLKGAQLAPLIAAGSVPPIADLEARP
jgi:pimeloyl-ACP methyl ester carboxylesterase